MKKALLPLVFLFSACGESAVEYYFETDGHVIDKGASHDIELDKKISIDYQKVDTFVVVEKEKCKCKHNHHKKNNKQHNHKYCL